MGVYAEQLAAESELWVQLDVKQLEVLAAESQALVDHAMAMVKANASMLGSSASPRAVLEGETRAEPPQGEST